MTFCCLISDLLLLSSNNNSNLKGNNSRCLPNKTNSSSSSSSNNPNRNLLQKRMTQSLNLMTSWQEWPLIQLPSSNNKCKTNLLPTKCLWTMLTHSPPICQTWIWWAIWIWTTCRCLIIWAWVTHSPQINLWIWTWVVSIPHNLPTITYLAAKVISRQPNNLFSQASMLLLLMVDQAQTHGQKMALMFSVTNNKSVMIARTIRFKNSKIFSH